MNVASPGTATRIPETKEGQKDKSRSKQHKNFSNEKVSSPYNNFTLYSSSNYKPKQRKHFSRNQSKVKSDDIATEIRLFSMAFLVAVRIVVVTRVLSMEKLAVFGAVKW